MGEEERKARTKGSGGILSTLSALLAAEAEPSSGFIRQR